MTKNELAENLSIAVDNLGDVRAQKDILSAKEKELSDYIKKHGKPGVTIHGKFFTCELVKSTKRVIDAVKAFKKLGKDKFLSICSVAIKDASRVMSDEEIDALSEVSDGPISARTKAIPQARNLEYPAFNGQESIEL